MFPDTCTLGDSLKNFYTALAAYVCIVVILLGFQTADAQEKPPVVKQPLAQFKISQDHADLEFADGRVARLMLSVRVFVPQIKTQLQVIENMCSPEFIGGDCEWATDYIDARIAFLWVVHPNPEKINQVLKVKVITQSAFSQNSSSTIERSLESNTNNILHPFYFKEKSPIVLSCKDDRWLQQMYQKSQQKFIVQSWVSESMTPNEITGKNENMSQLQLNNTELISLGSGHYQLNVTDKEAGVFARLTPIQETQTLYFQQEAKQCSVQLKNSIDEIRKARPEDPNVFIDQYPALLPADIPRGVVVDDVYKFAPLIKIPSDQETVEVE